MRRALSKWRWRRRAGYLQTLSVPLLAMTLDGSPVFELKPVDRVEWVESVPNAWDDWHRRWKALKRARADARRGSRYDERPIPPRLRRAFFEPPRPERRAKGYEVTAEMTLDPGAYARLMSELMKVRT